jgi:hypothetical protein
MAKRPYDDDPYFRPAVQAPGPLFAQVVEPGPFDRSQITPEPLERAIADIIWRHKGYGDPVSIAAIRAAAGIDERKVKDVVMQLRMTHRMRIGARRDGGYFVIVTADDWRKALTAYVHQIRTMAKVVRALADEAEYREFLGQLRLEEVA